MAPRPSGLLLCAAVPLACGTRAAHSSPSPPGRRVLLFGLDAVPHFERAIETGGPTTVAPNGLGFARLEAGDAAGGMAALRRSLSLQPRQQQVAAAVDQLARGRRP